MGVKAAPEALLLLQELVNSRNVETGQDRLTTPEGRAEFSRRHDLKLAAADLGALRELREALRAACLAHAGIDVPPERARLLERLFGEAPLVVGFDAAGRATLRAASRGTTGVPALVARVATAIAVAEVDGSWQRLKACEAEDCQWAYYDRSPAGRRRWCSMQGCGSRAKMRSYRSRRQGRTDGPDGSGGSPDPAPASGESGDSPDSSPASG